jgi:hypothetical protein
VTVVECQQLTLRSSLLLLPGMAHRVVGFLQQLQERNRDPYLTHRLKPAIAAIEAGEHEVARRRLELALDYLQHRERR